jgi:putative ABC transport system substrate-binding protein
VPAAKRIGWISTGTALQTVAGGEYTGVYGHLDAAARKLGVDLRRRSVRKREDFDDALAGFLAEKVQALGVGGGMLTAREAPRLVEFANRNRLPSAFGFREPVEAGGLLSYGPDGWAIAAQCMVYVDRILRGAKPADLPVELPSKQELAINLRTARALGITVPQPVLLRADRVIE